jgi:dihydroorotase
LWDLAYCDVAGCLRAIDEHREHIAGVKVRCMDNISRNGENEREGLRRARQAADEAGLPLVVHPVRSSLSAECILESLHRGDVLTHCYHGQRPQFVDSHGRVLPIVREKLREGVLLDVGHGAGSFTFRIARTLMDQGVLPDFIGSDLHRYNLHGPVFDLPTTLDKFLHLGMPVAEIICRTTWNCARFLGMGDEIGTLQAGACADLTVLEIESGEFALVDTERQMEAAERRFVVQHCFRSGRSIDLHPSPRDE